MGTHFRYNDKQVIISNKDTTTSSYNNSLANVQDKKIEFTSTGETLRTFTCPYIDNYDTGYALNFIASKNETSNTKDIYYAHRLKDGRNGATGAYSTTREFFYLTSNLNYLTNYEYNGNPFIQFLSTTMNNGTASVSWPTSFDTSDVAVIVNPRNDWCESVCAYSITATGANLRGIGIDPRNGASAMYWLGSTVDIMAIKTGFMPYYKNGYPMILAGTGTTDTDGDYTVSWTTPFESSSKMSVFISARSDRSHTLEAFCVRNITTTSFRFNSYGRGNSYPGTKAIPFSYVVIAHTDDTI